MCQACFETVLESLVVMVTLERMERTGRPLPQAPALLHCLSVLCLSACAAPPSAALTSAWCLDLGLTCSCTAFVCSKTSGFCVVGVFDFLSAIILKTQNHVHSSTGSNVVEKQERSHVLGWAFSIPVFLHSPSHLNPLPLLARGHLDKLFPPPPAPRV